MPCRLVCALLAVGASAAFPQAPTAQPPQEQPSPVFRSGVDLVRLDVRVTDANDIPIRDVRVEDIEVIEDGTARPIVLFQHIAQPLGTYVEAAQRTIAAEVSTNQGAPRGNVYVLVFDQGHIAPGNEQRARLAAQRFLRTRVKPGDGWRSTRCRAPDRRSSSRRTRPAPASNWSQSGHVGGRRPGQRQYDAHLRGLRDHPRQCGGAFAGDRPDDGERRRHRRDRPRRTPRQCSRRGRPCAHATPGHGGCAHPRGAGRRRVAAVPAHAVRRDCLACAPSRAGKSVILFSEGFPVDNLGPELLRVAAAAAQSYCVVYASISTAARVGRRRTARGGELATEVQSRLQMFGSLTAETDGVLFTDASPSSIAC